MLCNSCGEELSNDGICLNCENQNEQPSHSFESEEIKKANLFSKNIFSGINNNSYSKENGFYKNIKNKKKKTIKRYALGILCFILVIFAVFIYINRENIFYSSKGKRTIMIYMIGSDLESKHFAASKDIDEIVNSSINYDDVNILIYTGGTRSWHTDIIPNNKHALFEIDNGVLKKIDEYDVSDNMLDYQNLSFLLNYAYDNYDTEHYDLIFWDHGAGPIYGYGYDEYHKLDSMSLIDIKEALKNSPFNGANKLELVGFDACLMSSVEVAYILSDYADYMIASQEFEPGTGWDYSFLEKINKDLSSINFGMSIIDNYYEYYDDNNFVNGISLSLLKLNKIEIVEKNINDLFSSVDYDLVLDFSSISKVRTDSKSFGKYNIDDYYYDLVDVVDLIDRLPSKYNDKVSKLKSSLNDFVLYQKTDLSNTNGVSIYFPFDNKKEIIANLEKYKELSFAPNYYDFISNFVTKLTGDRLSNWDITESAVSQLDKERASITLTNEVLENYSSISYIVFQKLDDNTFIPIYTDDDVLVEGNKVSTSILNKALVAQTSSGSMFITSIQSEEGEDYTKYIIPGLLSRWDSETLEFESVPVYLEFIITEKQPSGFVSRILPMELNNNYTYSQVEYDLKDWDSLTLTNYKYNIVDETGNYMSDWINSSSVELVEYYTDEDIKISLSNIDISNDYYCLFVVKDSQGNSYYSNITSINKK